MSILSQKNTDDIIYVYRLGKDQRPVKPHLLKCDVFEDFLDWLRDYYGSGRYHLLIRRGRVMVFSGNIAIES
ncbi:MAG: hypothetical protein KGI54_08230 [Pseudomonadota bacterium]|nr:hypothetical protein [Pseudomonadota bacterium]